MAPRMEYVLPFPDPKHVIIHIRIAHCMTTNGTKTMLTPNEPTSSYQTHTDIHAPSTQNMRAKNPLLTLTLKRQKTNHPKKTKNKTKQNQQTKLDLNSI